MAANSTIEWTQTTWNPVVGCTKVSEGCRHCYAERMSKRLSAMARTAEKSGADPGRKANYKRVVNTHGWSGRVVMDAGALDDPRHWRNPRLVFVNSMSDLFHPGIDGHFIARVFSVMAECSQHTFQVLTKRPERAAALGPELPWPKNVWLGTSVESVDVVDRVQALRRVPAQVRFISAEPLITSLGTVDLAGIHWLIAGGESGPGARPMSPEWVRQLRDQCVASGVAFFFKQWGGVNKKRAGRRLDGRYWNELPRG